MRKRTKATWKNTIFSILVRILDVPHFLMPYIQYIPTRLKYKNVKIFRKGGGGLSKYIITKGNKKLLIKKSNFLVHTKFALYNLLQGEKVPPFHKRYTYLRKILKIPKFKKVNLCTNVKSNSMTYTYIEGAKQANKKNMTENLCRDIILAIKALHQKGYFFSDLNINNVVIKNKKAYLTDIESIEPMQDASDMKYDFDFLIKSIKNKDLQKRMKKVISNVTKK